MNATASPRLDFPSLVHEHQGTVYSVALRVVRDRAAAEDVSQQVFLRLFQEKGIPPGVASPKAYVARIAVNAALNALRATERRARHEEKAPARSTPMSPTAALEQRELHVAVDELPIELRLPVALHYFQGLSYAEVAESLEVPSGTVASRIHSAIGRLRTTLAGIAVLAAAGSVEAALEGASDEEVPPDLTERLLRIPELPPVPPAPPAAVAIASAISGPFAAVALILVTTGVALLAVTRLANPGGTHVAVTPPAMPPATVATTSSTPTPAGSTAVVSTTTRETAAPPVAVAEAPTTIDGFLLARPDGTIEVGEIYTDPVQTMASAPYVLDAESARPFEGMAAASSDVMEFWKDAAKVGSFPRVWVRVKGTVRHEAGGTRDAFDMGINWFTVGEVVSVDWLSDGWLLGWRAARLAEGDLAGMLSEPPSKDKRARFIERAQAAMQAVSEMRRQGELGGPPQPLEALPQGAPYRKGVEQQLLRSLRNLTAPFALTPVGVPEFPTVEEIRGVFFSAKDPSDMRSAIVARWGEDALDGTLSYYEGTKDSFSWVSRDLSALLKEWTPEEYRAAQERARAIPENLKTFALPEQPAYEAHRERVKGSGLGLGELAVADRQTYLVANGVKVTSVAQGSAADQAGLRVGDVIWRAHVPNHNPMGGTPGRIEAQAPSNVVNFGYLLGEAKGMEGVTLDVLRDGGCVQVVLKRE